MRTVLAGVTEDAVQQALSAAGAAVVRDRVVTYGAAAFGGIATSLFGLAIDLTRGQPLPTPSFLLGLAILAFLGAMVAVFLGETNCKKAFFLGLGLPSLIQVGAARATQDPPAGPEKDAMFSLLPVAHAAGKEVSVPGRTLKVRADGEAMAYEVVFSSGDGRREEKVAVPAAPGEKSLSVPDYASRFVVQVGSARSVNQPLPPRAGTVTVMKLNVRPKPWSGLKQSLGVQQAAGYDVVIEPVAR
jgi:hypothetical protein